MRSIPDPGFAGDDGTTDPELESALRRYAEDPAARHAETLARLQESRLLVPVTAVVGEVEYDEQGLAHDKTSDMATVLMRGRDGRLALLAFTGLEAMRRWDQQARPVPVTAPQAAYAARSEQAAALVVDVAGPVLFVVEGSALDSLADGFRLVSSPTGWIWTKPGQVADGRG